MSMEPTDDAHHALLERRRSLVMQHLTRVLDALERKRLAVTEVVTDVVDPPPAVARRRARTAVAVAGAVAGVAAVTAMLWVDHRRHRPRGPMALLGRFLGRYVRPPPPPLLKQLALKAVTSLFLSLVAEIVKRRIPDADAPPVHA